MKRIWFALTRHLIDSPQTAWQMWGFIQGVAHGKGYKLKENKEVRMLPAPNAVFVPSGGPATGSWTEEDVRGIVSNPVYAGVGPHPSLVNDEVWIQAAIKQIEEVGAPQFLVNMLYCLRKSFEEVTE